MLKILFISANPRDTDKPLSVENERSKIEEKNEKFENRYEFENWDGVRAEQLLTILSRFRPNVLHFTGHASKEGVPMFLKTNDDGQLVPADPFVHALTLYKEHLKCVVLNACYTFTLAEKICEHIKCVIGSTDTFDDKSEALKFSPFFYYSILGGDSVGSAFEKAKTQVAIERGRANIFEIHPGKDVNPDTLYLLPVPRKQLYDYLDRIISETFQAIEAPPPETRNGTFIRMRKYWNVEDATLEKGDVRYAMHIISEFLDDEESTDLVIGAGFGVGKSSFVKKVAYDLAKKAKAHDTGYVPILVSDTNNMDTYHKRRSVEELIQNTVAPYDRHKKILIIFDKVEEHKDGAKALLKRVRSSVFQQYDMRKIILITRLNPEFPEEYGANDDDRYVRLLPFSVPQVDEFFKNLKTDLTYEKAIEFGVSDEDIRKPLLAFLLSTVYLHNQEDLLRLKEDESLTLTSNEYKAFILLQFIRLLIEAKTEKAFDRFREEKEILRRIALVMKLFRENLTENVILDGHGVFTDFFQLAEDRLKQVLLDYFDISASNRSGPKERRVLFLKSTFKEYLMAENYIEMLLLGNHDGIVNLSWMNVAIPTMESVQFLEGLLGLIEKRTKSDTIRKWIDVTNDNQGGLFDSYAYGEWRNDPHAKLIEHSSSDIDDDTVSLLMRTPSEFKEKTHSHFMSGAISFNVEGAEPSYAKFKSTDINEYENLWIHRWISLFVLNTVDTGTYSRRLDKEKLIRLIVLTSNKIPGYLTKLAGCNLSSADLSLVNLSDSDISSADLSRAKLSNSNLFSANLVHANLCEADLSRADLSEANLSEAHLCRANLSRADLPRANLSRAKLVGTKLIRADLSSFANFSNADLSRAVLYEAILSNANLSGANLSEASLVRADLTEANLVGANLTGVDLTAASISDANLTGVDLTAASISNANLTGSKIFGCQRYEKLVCDNADFSGAQIDNESFVKYLIVNKAKNVPDVIIRK